MKHILYLVALFALLAPGNTSYATAQSNKVLQGIAKQLDHSQGIRIDFEIASEQDNENTTFSYYGQGQSFYMEADFMKAWHNGTSLWTYTPGSGEVNLTTPSPLYIAEVNPLVALSQLSEKNYRITTTKESKGYKLVAHPLKGSVYEMYCALLEVFTNETYKPTTIVIKDRDNLSASIKIRKIERGVKLSPALFVFTQDKLPNAQVIDLRK